jgi:hypothetical protein
LRLRTLAPALALPLVVAVAATAAGLHAQLTSSPLGSRLDAPRTLVLPVQVHTPASLSPTQPSPRSGAALAWDPAHHVDLLYGGAGPQGGLGDTWTWNGTTWTQLNPATSPPAMKDAAMAWDSTRGRVVLLGRSDFNPTSGEVPLNMNMDLQTWTWTGATWQRDENAGIATEAFAGSPVLVDDPNAHRLLALAAFRPHSGGTTLYTYAWADGKWTLLDSNLALDSTTFGAAWDTATNKVRLVQTYDGGKAEHVFELAGTSWVDAKDGPAATGAALLTDPTRAGLVQPDTTATWIWDGARWHSLPPPALNGLTGAAAAPDLDRHTVVLFGGRTTGGGVEALSDHTLTWDGSLWSPRGGGPLAVIPARTPSAELVVPACPPQRGPSPTTFTRSGDSLDADITLPAPTPGCTTHSVEIGIVDDNGTPRAITGNPIVVKTGASHIRVRWQNWCGSGVTFFGVGLDHEGVSSEIIRPPSCGDPKQPSTLRLLS